MTLHKNLIAGEWVDRAVVVANVNPSDTRDVIGETIRASQVFKFFAGEQGRYATEFYTTVKTGYIAA